MPAKSSYHHGHLRPVLLAAALRALRRGGVQALSLRALARQAGVSPAAPYRHFPTKTALLDALATEGYHRLLDVLGRPLQRHPAQPRIQFQAAAQAYLRFAEANPEWLQLMFTHSPLNHDALQGLIDNPQASFLQIICEGQRCGQIAPGDPLDLTVAAFAFLRGLSTLRLEHHFKERWSQAKTRTAWIASLTDWFWFGMARREKTR